MVKKSGGVAVDIGSGFDLLSGMVSRPVHKKIDLNTVLKKWNDPKKI
jgi:hypothetical protein